MKRGIKARLIAAFFLVNATFLASFIALFFMNSYVVNKYTQVVGTMSSEHKLNEALDQLINVYGELVLSNSVILSKNKQKIEPIKAQITIELQNLNQAVVDPKAKLSFNGLKSAIDQTIDEVDRGLEDVSLDKPTSFTHYQQANRYYDFVQANSITFTLDQLAYIDTVGGRLRATNSALQIAAGALIFTVAIGSVIFGLRFAGKFVAPLSKLTIIAGEISSDNMTVQFDPALLKRTDEVGSLSNSFHVMFERLKGEIKELGKEKAVAEGERAKDEAILNSIGDGMIVTDSAGYILLINEIALDLLGLDSSSIVGGQAFDSYQLYDESDRLIPTENRPLFIALKQGQKNLQAVRYTKKDGSKSSLSVTATPVIQQGKIIGGIQIIRNITKEKEVDRMKTEFISLASHQLRTPLSAIKWFSEMLVAGDAGKLTPEQEEFAENISQSTQRMIELVNSLLNISRMESGRIIVDPQPTDLKELVQTLAKELEVKTIERNQTLVISVHADLPKINVDPKLIRQVYLNLLTNAIKYTPKGGEISVFISRKDDDVVSQVTDNGYGIPKSEQVKAFQKFFRATNIVKVETDGTGLGLYLIKAIIEASKGKIWFESIEGKGTTFWFSLPMSGMEARKGEVTLDG